MGNVISNDLHNQWEALQNALSAALDNKKTNPDGITQALAQIYQFAKANGIDPSKPVTIAGAPPPVGDPNDLGFVKQGGWGSKSTDPSLWKIVKMNDSPDLFKVVDEKGINVAANFKTQTGAQAYINAIKAHTTTPPSPPPSPPPSGGGTPSAGGDNGVDQFGIKQIYKSKPGGQVVTTHKADYFTRHYASGKPSEPTVEMDISPITFADQECTAIITMTGMSHPDTIDWKLRGGVHSSSTPKTGTCYDVEVMSNGDPKMTLEVESPHPDNHAAHQKALFSPGDLSKARFGWKGVTLTTADGKGVLIESYINLTPDDNNGWKKYISVVDTGQLLKGTSPILKPYGQLAKIRIDGIVGKPLFDKVSAREITN